ncbi:MAG: radical SAM protein [Candidatus Omnitrophota bacterium]
MAIIHITNSCNLQCEFCWHHSPLQKSHVKPLSLNLPILVSMFKDLAAMGTKEICLNAQGEPSSHPQFAEIVNTIKETGMSLKIHTNLALYSPKIISAFERADHLVINLSAVDEKSYRKIHAPLNKHSFKNVLKNISHIVSINKRFGNPHFEIIYIITKNNFRQIGQAIELARSNGIPSISFKILQTTSSTQKLHFNHQQRIHFLKDIALLMRQSTGIRTNLKDVFDEFFTKRNVSIPFEHCYIGWLTIYIKQNGIVGLCCQNGRLTIGDWRENTLREIWNGSRAQQLRLLAKDHLHLKSPFGDTCQHCCYSITNANIEKMLARIPHQPYSIAATKKIRLIQT